VAAHLLGDLALKLRGHVVVVEHEGVYVVLLKNALAFALHEQVLSEYMVTGGVAMGRASSIRLSVLMQIYPSANGCCLGRRAAAASRPACRASCCHRVTS